MEALQESVATPSSDTVTEAFQSIFARGLTVPPPAAPPEGVTSEPAPATPAPVPVTEPPPAAPAPTPAPEPAPTPSPTAPPPATPTEQPEPVENAAISDIRMWGRRERQAKSEALTRVNELQTAIEQLSPVKEIVEKLGGKEVVEHAVKGHQVMFDPRFDSADEREQFDATRALLEHLHNTNPANYRVVQAALERQFDQYLTPQIGERFAQNFMGIPMSAVTPQMEETLKTVGRAIANGTYVEGQATTTTSQPASGALPDWCYFYDDYGERAGENPAAVADYRRSLQMQSRLDGIEKAQKDSQAKAAAAEAQARKAELESLKGTYFNEAFAPIDDVISKALAPLATDSVEVRSGKEHVSKLLKAGFRTLLQEEPVYSEMSSLLTKGAKIDAVGRKAALQNKAKFLFATVAPLLSVITSAGSIGLQAQLQSIATADNPQPRNVTTNGAKPPVPNVFDKNLFPNGPFSSEATNALKIYTSAELKAAGYR